jgi:tetratricopeptide (TPR) repeat protein
VPEPPAEAKPAAPAAVAAAAAPPAPRKVKPQLAGAKAKGLATRGGVRANLKKYGEAAQVWTELLELEPGYYPAYAERGYSLAMSGEKEKAEADFRKAFESDPDQPRAYLLRGAAACAAGDFGGASADLEKALSLDPKIKRDILYSFTANSVRMKKNCK